MKKDFVSSTPGQAYEAYLQIEKAVKANGKINLFDALSELIGKKVLEKAVNEYYSGKYAVVSEKFTATNIEVSTGYDGAVYNVRNDIAKLLPTKEEGGLFDYRDSDIISWFGDVDFTLEASVNGKVQKFRQNITHRDIITEGKILGIYCEYDIVEALILANELAKVGALNERGKGIVIYLKNQKGNVPCRLFVYRRDDGKLKVLVLKVNLDGEWNAGDGVLFS